MTSCIEGGLYPLQFTGLHHHHVKPASRPVSPTTQIHLGGEHNALALDRTYAGERTPMPCVAAAAHFDKNHGALRVAHNQVYLAAASSRRSVIALQQLQALVLQPCQGLVLGFVALALVAAWPA